MKQHYQLQPRHVHLQRSVWVWLEEEELNIHLKRNQEVERQYLCFPTVPGGGRGSVDVKSIITDTRNGREGGTISRALARKTSENTFTFSAPPHLSTVKLLINEEQVRGDKDR